MSSARLVHRTGIWVDKQYEVGRAILYQALQIAPDDPFVLHEMGVISFQNAEYVGKMFF